MSPHTLFAQWLRAEMPKRGYPVEGPRAGGLTRLAKDAQVSQANLSRVASGQQQPSLDLLRKLGAVLGYELVEMMGFAGLATPPAERQADRPRLESIEGSGQDPQKYTEPEFFADLVNKRGVLTPRGTRVPPYPPGGFTSDFDRDLWQGVLTGEDPPDVIWPAIRAIRAARAEIDARRAAERAAERAQHRRGERDAR